MNKRFTLFSLIFIFSIALLSYQVSYALFSSSASNVGNVISASTAFPTPIPTNTPIPTATPIPTNTPIPTPTPISTCEGYCKSLGTYKNGSCSNNCNPSKEVYQSGGDQYCTDKPKCCCQP